MLMIAKVLFNRKCCQLGLRRTNFHFNYTLNDQEQDLFNHRRMQNNGTNEMKKKNEKNGNNETRTHVHKPFMIIFRCINRMS